MKNTEKIEKVVEVIRKNTKRLFYEPQYIHYYNLHEGMTLIVCMNIDGVIFSSQIMKDGKEYLYFGLDGLDRGIQNALMEIGIDIERDFAKEIKLLEEEEE